MRATRSVARLAVALLSLSTVVSATWPTVAPGRRGMVARQEDEEAQSSEPTKATPTTTGRRTPITTELNTGTRKPTGSSGGGKNATTTKGGEREMFDPRDPAGAVVMITPAVTLGPAVYKIGDHITWGWNYTYLQGTPTAIDLLVKCSAASATWTLTQNMTFASPGSYTWDTAAFQSANPQQPLPVEEYTMILYEADTNPTQNAEPGYLNPFTGFRFGLYTPKPYEPLGDNWQCATCSGAMSDMERRVLGGAVAMSIATFLSFTWFVGGFAAIL